MRYDIKLKIEYDYENSVGYSRHIIRLKPADLPGEQKLVACALDIDPAPDECIHREDFFGNQCAEIHFGNGHEKLQFSIIARVERTMKKMNDTQEMRLGDLAKELSSCQSMNGRSPVHYLGSSVRAPIAVDTRHYAKSLVNTDRSVLANVKKIGTAIFSDFKFDAKATTVETPMLEAFKGRRGVCQDFAHVMISCLRGVGIPAAYVSGFLRTKPPEGKARLEGADAMHAWVAAWCGPNIGWVEYDPTNKLMVGPDHIVIARGRDYFDVAPVKGVMRTVGKHKSKQSVDVIPIA